MKKRLIIFLAIVLAFSMVFSVSCKKHATKDDYSQVAPVPDDANLDPESGINLLPEGNGIIFDEEIDGAELSYKKEDPSKFVGEWEATSDQASHLYGNVNIKINDDHTWTANITDEDVTGKWEETKTGIKLKSDYWNYDLDFDEGGNLIMTEKGEGDASDHHTVLTRPNADEQE